jgi:hypothetical protein
MLWRPSEKDEANALTIVPSERFVQAHHVRAVEQGGTVVLLCLRSLKYLRLQGALAVAWQSLKEAKSAEIVAAEICRTCSGDEAVRYTSRLFKALLAKGLIAPEGAAVPAEVRSVVRRRRPQGQATGRSPRVPSVGSCLARLTFVHAMLVVIGFNATLNVLTRRHSPATQLSTEWLRRFSSNASQAAMLYPFGAKCLAQSLCLLSLLRSAGAAGNLQIGVSVFPFSAHAWVELEGKALCHNPEYLRQFVRFDSIGPPTT